MVLEFENTDQKPIDPVMSWVGSSDTSSQIKLKFATKEEAIQYAKKIIFCFSSMRALKKR